MKGIRCALNHVRSQQKTSIEAGDGYNVFFHVFIVELSERHVW